MSKNKLNENLKNEFLAIEDNDYLKDTNRFISKALFYIDNGQEIIRNKLQKFINELENGNESVDNETTIQYLHDLIKNDATSMLFTQEELASCIKINSYSFEIKKTINAAFISAVLRYLLLKNPSVSEEEKLTFWQRLENTYELSKESYSSIEISLLFQFNRAILFLKKFCSANRNKGLFIHVANMLENSPSNTRYTTGGRSSDATIDRLNMIEKEFALLKRKRQKKIQSILLSNYESSDLDESNSEKLAIPQIKTIHKGVLLDVIDYSNSAVKKQRKDSVAYDNYSKIQNQPSSDLKLGIWKENKALLILYWQYQQAFETDNLELLEELHDKLALYSEEEKSIFSDYRYSSKDSYLEFCRTMLGHYDKLLKYNTPYQKFSLFEKNIKLKTDIEDLKSIINELESKNIQINSSSTGLSIK